MIIWPACSPDLNPLDFAFWSIIEDLVFKSHPKSITQIKEKVQQCVDELNSDPDKVRRFVGNIEEKTGALFSPKWRPLRTLTLII